MTNFLNSEYKDLRTTALKNTEKYQNALPFPNIHFENFFDEDTLDSVLEEFPDLSQENVRSFNEPRQIKYGAKGESLFRDNTRSFMHFLNSEPFLYFLQALTGIEEILVSDPYFSGGGQQEIKRGGLLKIHADFNKHPLTGLDRRLNVLIYLNKDWKPEYGGNFELWDSDMKGCVKSIPPSFNTMAIFSTSDYSYHGHPDPLTCPEENSRKSLALYYYSNGRPQEEINHDLESHSTLFRARHGHENELEEFQS